MDAEVVDRRDRLTENERAVLRMKNEVFRHCALLTILQEPRLDDKGTQKLDRVSMVCTSAFEERRILQLLASLETMNAQGPTNENALGIESVSDLAKATNQAKWI